MRAHLLGMTPRRGLKGTPWRGSERYPMLDRTISACTACAVSQPNENLGFQAYVLWLHASLTKLDSTLPA